MSIPVHQETHIIPYVPDDGVVRRVSRRGFQLLVDAGVFRQEQEAAVMTYGIHTINGRVEIAAPEEVK